MQILSKLIRVALASVVMCGSAGAADPEYYFRPVPGTFGPASPGGTVQVPPTLVFPTVQKPPSGSTYSEPARYDGPTGTATITVVGGKIHVCTAEAACPVQPGAVFEDEVSVRPGTWLRLRVDEPSTGGTVTITPPTGSPTTTTFTTSPNIGGGQPPVVPTPSLGTFATVVVPDPATSATSASATYGGPDANMTLSGDPSATMVRCRASVCTRPDTGVSVQDGDAIAISMISGAAGETRTAVVTTGAVSASWSLKTEAPDVDPDRFSIAGKTGLEENQLWEDQGSHLAKGFVGSLRLAVDGGEVSVNGGSWTSSTTISAGSTMRFRAQAATYGQLVPVTIELGTMAVSWFVMAGEYDESQFEEILIQSGGHERNVLVESQTIDPDLWYETEVSVEFGEISVNGLNDWRTGVLTLQPGDTFRLRQTSSDLFTASTFATVRADHWDKKVLWTFSVDTRDADYTPDTIDFRSVAYPPDTTAVSEWLTITGIDEGIQTSVYLSERLDEDGIQVWPASSGFTEESEPLVDSVNWAGKSVRVSLGDKVRLRTKRVPDAAGTAKLYVYAGGGGDADRVSSIWLVFRG